MRELAAALVEEMAATVVEGLRGAPGGTPGHAPEWAPGLEAPAGTTDNPYTNSAGLPRPEEGDEHAGQLYGRALRAGLLVPQGNEPQDGFTEEEYEAGMRVPS
jgi:hypothetical protein